MLIPAIAWCDCAAWADAIASCSCLYVAARSLLDGPQAAATAPAPVAPMPMPSQPRNRRREGSLRFMEASPIAWCCDPTIGGRSHARLSGGTRSAVGQKPDSAFILPTDDDLRSPTLFG